jgi:hypothetical protein
MFHTGLLLRVDRVEFKFSDTSGFCNKVKLVDSHHRLIKRGWAHQIALYDLSYARVNGCFGWVAILWLAKIAICCRIKQMNGLSDLVCLRVKLVSCCVC